MKHPRIKKETRRKMNRSGVFNCDVCSSQELLVEHHINGRNIPNCNHPSNLSKLCSNCHKKVHEGIIIIEKWIMTTNGLKLFWHSVDDNSFSGEDSSPYIIP